MSLLNDFCTEFGVNDIGNISRVGRRCFLTQKEQDKEITKHKKNLFGIGVFLGEEKAKFEPSPALVELIAAKTKKHKAVVDEKAAWLFLCGRDIFIKGVVKQGTPTANGYLLVENAQGENLGYGQIPKKKQKNVAIKNVLDRGFFLRRERMA